MSCQMNRVGVKRKTLQGLTTEVVRYIDDNNVSVVIRETGEIKVTNWKTFSKGLIRTDLSKVHKNEDCKCQHKSAKDTTIVHKSWIMRLKQWLLRLLHRIFRL